MMPEPVARKLLLLVEDNEVEREGLLTILSREGFLVYAAGNGARASEQLCDPAPDLILLDMLMPGADGWHLLRRRRVEWPAVPVLVLTPLSIPSDAWAGALGAPCWLRKPVSAEELLAQVGRCLAA